MIDWSVLLVSVRRAAISGPVVRQNCVRSDELTGEKEEEEEEGIWVASFFRHIHSAASISTGRV